MKKNTLLLLISDAVCIVVFLIIMIFLEIRHSFAFPNFNSIAAFFLFILSLIGLTSISTLLCLKRKKEVSNDKKMNKKLKYICVILLFILGIITLALSSFGLNYMIIYVFFPERILTTSLAVNLYCYFFMLGSVPTSILLTISIRYLILNKKNKTDKNSEAIKQA